MPFGAELLPEGGVRFRLWAPKPERVDLVLDGSPVTMQKNESGWFEFVAKQAKAGSRYQFAIDGKLRVPDPASRFQPEDVHEPSQVVSPQSFEWTDDGWRGRPWKKR